MFYYNNKENSCIKMRIPGFHIKKMDLFITKTFLGNLMGTFLICLFIFIMQLLWMWVDDFVEKGLDMAILLKFFAYGSITLVSQSLPLSILLAALMTFGNFGEKLELLSMKAAGIPLLRIMAPLIICCSILCCISFYFQNVISPYAHMKLYTMMYSIKQSSPESEIPEGVFYDRIDGYNIYVEHKDKETGVLHDVIIYDMSSGFENSNIIVSDSAEIINTNDDKLMMLVMYSGEQFSNLTDQQIEKKNRPYRRETFSRKDIYIQIEGGFEMKDASFVKSNAASKNIKELSRDIDSLKLSNDSVGEQNWKTMARSTYKASVSFTKNDSLLMQRNRTTRINVDSVYDIATNHSKLVWKRAQLNKAKQLKTDYEIKHNIMRSLDKNLNRHKISWWEKFTLSFGCLVFFFIGAPLGAIVRKGGLGYPVLISVATFILYYILSTSGSKLAREGQWHVWYGVWLSTMVLAPLGGFFTYKANKDSGIFNSDSIKMFFRTLFGIPEKRHVTIKEVIIEDPDYNNDSIILEDLYEEARLYKKKNNLKRLPSIKEVFFNEQDTELESFNDKLEKVIEELGNSKEKKVIIQLNEFPVLSINEITSPFKKRLLNILSIVAFPLGIIIYLRAVRFRIRLLKDLVKIETNTKKLTNIFKKQNLI